jgi:thioredoxin-related protein
MFCKLGHGKIEIIWYLQISKACQVVECPSLDWCNLIRKQITTKYKIRTKYNENLRPNQHNESRKTTYTEGHKDREKERERERANGKQWLTLEN